MQLKKASDLAKTDGQMREDPLHDGHFFPHHIRCVTPLRHATHDFNFIQILIVFSKTGGHLLPTIDRTWNRFGVFWRANYPATSGFGLMTNLKAPHAVIGV